LSEWSSALTLGRMTSIPGFFIHHAMRGHLVGAHAQDPVVPDGLSIPDRPLRIDRLDDRLATLVDARARRRALVFADRADERRAA
jgi:hypothetical protein